VSATPAELIGVAFTATESGRRALRVVFPGCTFPPFKAGSVHRHCTRCRLAVIVGPRLAASGLAVICPLCAHDLGLSGFWPSGGAA